MAHCSFTYLIPCTPRHGPHALLLIPLLEKSKAVKGNYDDNNDLNAFDDVVSRRGFDCSG